MSCYSFIYMIPKVSGLHYGVLVLQLLLIVAVEPLFQPSCNRFRIFAMF